VASHISAFAMSFGRNSVKCGTLLGSVGRTQNWETEMCLFGEEM
jgi:hypothetical protein